MPTYKKIVTHSVRLTAYDLWEILKQKGIDAPENIPNSFCTVTCSSPNDAGAESVYVDVMWRE